jgi:hypothetical protein
MDTYEYFLKTEGLDHYLADTDEKLKKCTNGWLSPDAKAYFCGMAEHFLFADYVLGKIYKEYDYDDHGHHLHDYAERLETACKKLIEHGWIYFENYLGIGTIISGVKVMNERQYKVLHKIFGESRGFAHGMTITEIWHWHQEEMRKGNVGGSVITDMHGKDPLR